MPQYMLLSYQSAKDGSPHGDQAAERARWTAFDQQVKGAGIHRAGQSLARPDTATTVRMRDYQTLITDGPVVETEEYLAGCYLIEASDLDTALTWAARMPSCASGAVEVRPVRAG